MKLILHIVRKDFRLLRSRLLLWWVLLALKTIVGCYLVMAAPLEGVDLALVQAGLLQFAAIDVALTVLLAGLLVQTDPLDSAAGAWRTRPISRGRLLTAKVFGAIAFLLLPPVLFALPWWWVCGFTAPQMFGLAAEALALSLLVAGPALVLGSVTTSVVQQFVAAVVMLVALVGVATLSGRVLGVPADAFIFRNGVAVLIFALLGTAVLVARFLGLPIVRARIALGVVVVFAGVAANLLPAYAAPFLQQRGQSETRPKASDIKLNVALVSAEVSQPLKKGRPRYVRMRYAVTGAPDRTLVGGGMAQHEFTFASQKQKTESAGLSSGDDRALALAVALGGIDSVRNTDTVLGSYATLSLAEEQAFHSERIAYRGQLEFELLRPAVAARSELVKRRFSAGENRGFRILSVQSNPGGDRILNVIETSPYSFLQEAHRALLRMRPLEPFVYVMHDATHTHATTDRGRKRSSFTLAGVSVQLSVLAFGGWTRGASGSWAEDGKAVVTLVSFAARERIVVDVAAPELPLARDGEAARN
jgi:hypothetical protein